MTAGAGEVRKLDAQLALDGVIRDPDWMFKTGMGGMLSATALVLFGAAFITWPLAVVAGAIICGYVLRVARLRVANPNAPLPAWDNWADLLMSGLSWFAVQFVFFWIIPVTFVALISLGKLSGWLDLSSPLFLPFAIFAILDITLLWIVVSITVSGLMIHFAVQENMAAGWQVFKVFMRLARKPKTFAIAWMLGFGMQVLCFVVPSITFVGLFFLPTTIFAGQIFNATLLAQAWAAAEQEINELA